MEGRKIILLVGALVIAAVTALMARSMIAGSSAPNADAEIGAPAPAEPQGPSILVATRALPVGTILDANALKFQPWPKELVKDVYYLKGQTDVGKLQGTVVRYAIAAGQPLTNGALVKPGDRGFLAAALSPGMRAVTVPVAAENAVAGFVFPGDRVDLLLTQSVEGGGDGPPLKAAETIVRNLRVLATDQSTNHKTDDDGNTVVQTFSTVTVEATPKIAEQIAVAESVGTLSLSLRSIADSKDQLEEEIANGEKTGPDDQAMLVDRDPRPSSVDPTYSTGADVSRFQRSSVPGKSSGGGSGGSQSFAGMPPQIIGAPGGYNPPVNAGDPSGTNALSGGADASQSASVIHGPVVRVARGNDVTVVPVGRK